jgi:CHAT domain-containing protein/tetratricopeptide (TPR) repeat protein
MNYRVFISLFFILLLVQKGNSQTPGTPCDSILKIGLQLYQKQNFKEAIPAFEIAMRLCSRDTGISDLDYYVLLSYLSTMYYEESIEDSALATGEPARKYFQKVKYTGNPVYSSLTVRLGLNYSHRARYEDAIKCFEEIIPFYEKTLGTASKQYIMYTTELATYYSAMSEFTKSLAINQKLRKIITANYSKEENYYIAVITNMGNDFARLSMYDSALACHNESLALREKKFGKTHKEYGKGLNNLGVIYNDMGRYSDAVGLYEQARMIYVNAKEERTGDYAGIMGQLGLIYTQLMDYGKADKYLHEALQTKQALYGYYHPEVASIYNNIASLYSNINNYEAAIKAYYISKNILEKTTGTGTYEYANLIGNLGLVYSDVKKYDSALYFLNQSLSYKEKIFGPENYALGSVLNNLAGVYGDLKNYDKAIVFYNKTINLVEKTFGKDAYNLSGINENLALVYKAKGDIKSADALLQKAYAIGKKNILQNTETLSEGEKESFAISIKGENHIGMSLRKEMALSNEWLYNSTLFYKGLLLEGARGLTSAFKQFTDAALQNKAKEYLQLKTYVGKQLLLPAENRDKDLVKKFSRSEELERELMQASSGFRSWKDQFNIDWKQVQKKLLKDEAAIEFVSYYRLADNDTTVYYSAMVIKQNDTEPQLVYLFKESDFNSLLNRSSSEALAKKLYRSTIKSSTQVQPSDSLYNIIWKPLLPALENIKTIYFAADGILNNLNLAAIISPAGRRLVEDYEFIQLTSTRNLLKHSPEPSFREVQLWGGIKYDQSATTSSERSAPFSYLPGTLTEITDINNAVNKAGKKTKTLVASEANETNFKNLGGQSPEVLHIATHGFFFPEPSQTKSDENRFAQSKIPLLRSGLVLANANNNWKEMHAPSNEEDGILTAYEIADMDLSQTKLVVLSACETGLGDVKSGEGVYGLQRAFKLAGVNYLIMSLWQVPDMETKEFMQTFYTNCLTGLPIRKAFRETQLAMNKKYQPYQWAAFVLIK